MLRSLLGILELDSASPLYQDTVAICDYLTRPSYRIAVFAPFNHGKSTLLNALLGSKTLPIDLIPTTGAAICVIYGEELKTVISLKNGSVIEREGIKVLQEYAILDGDRRMKDEVESVKVFCNNPWLKMGLEFLDLPGTNDREAQNDLVKDKLLSADLVIHVLDARKLMTLEERENLKYWLQNRGITTVIFVVNFLNLLTLEERKEVQQRLYFIAESFRSTLPSGVSNIYCVDALPALRARLKGDAPKAQTTGITSLESALQNIASSDRRDNFKLDRVVKISEQLLQQAIIKKQEIETRISSQDNKEQDKILIKQKAAKLIQQSFDRTVSDFRAWLYFPQLLTNYQPSLAIALQQTEFDRWLESEFKPEVITRQQAINKWIEQGCDFFAYHNPELLAIDLIHVPIIEIPEAVFDATEENNYKSYIPQELNFLLQKKSGGVVLGGANYLINKLVNKSPERKTVEPTPRISSQIYIDAAANYLQKFSSRANKILDRYEKLARQYITYIPPASNNQNVPINYQLQLLNSAIDNLQTELIKI